MLVGLHDSEGAKYPNLPLMKISTHLKRQGHQIEFYNQEKVYDCIFSAKVFTFTNEETLPIGTVKGGTGYRSHRILPDSVEHLLPDYSLYNSAFSMGFLTRGCPNKCSWCIVPDKEGDIRAHADVEEFAIHRDVVLMDNNVLASDHGISQIEKISRLGLKIDFNQGLDARRIDDGVAKRLSKCKWLHPLRLACDTKLQINAIQKAVTLLRWHDCTPRQYFVYVLVKDVEDALERVRFLKGMHLDPFAQPYRDFTLGGTSEPSKEQKAFARWVNHKAVFRSTTWEDYKYRHP